METDPTRIEPDDATPSGAGAPAPFETPDENPQPVEEKGEDARESPGGDA